MLGMCHDRRNIATGAHVCNNLVYCFYLPTRPRGPRPSTPSHVNVLLSLYQRGFDLKFVVPSVNQHSGGSLGDIPWRVGDNPEERQEG
jgi:hypothetical protein